MIHFYWSSNACTGCWNKVLKDHQGKVQNTRKHSTLQCYALLKGKCIYKAVLQLIYLHILRLRSNIWFSLTHKASTHKLLGCGIEPRSFISIKQTSYHPPPLIFINFSTFPCSSAIIVMINSYNKNLDCRVLCLRLPELVITYR